MTAIGLLWATVPGKPRLSVPLLGLLAILTVAPLPARAATVAGSFELLVTLTLANGPPQTIAPQANEAQVGATGLSGSFVGLGGTNVAIETLSNPPATVGGSGFVPTAYLVFQAAPALGTLSVDFVYPGTHGSAACAIAPAAGQTCSLEGFPFDFENTAGGGSRIGFVLSGVTSAGGTWTGVFTSQFVASYQSILAVLFGGGSVLSTYSASFTVVPEPGASVLALASLCVLARRARSRSSRP